MSVSSVNQVAGFVSMFCLGIAFAVPSMAAISPAHQEWRNGPAQWLMTAEEQRAWREVKTDAEAIHFIDLFWVRRDPTPGTPDNEFRNEFETRVVFADRAFAEPRKRGALTDRGRVYIVLGPAKHMLGATRTSTGQLGAKMADGYDPTGGRQLGARDVWMWEHAEAQKFDMPKIEVVFIEDPSTRRVQRDPQRGDFVRANGVAVQKAIVNPGLTELPEWAPRGGLEPRVLRFESRAPRPVEEAPAVATEEDTPFAGPGATAAPGASRLVLVKGKSLPSGDPLAAASASAFSPRDGLAWGLQFCSSTPATPRLKHIAVITGPLDGDSSERVTKEKDATLIPLKGLARCYLLQGGLALPNLPRGRYELMVMIDDAVTWDSFKVQQLFKVE
jgi:GWxTD domain-containing protein